MNKTIRLRLVKALGFALALGSQPLYAEVPDIDQESLKQLNSAINAVSAGKQLSATVDYGYDVLQKNGQLIEYGGTRTITYDRPTRMRIDNRQRGGERHVITYDGKHLVLTTPGLKFYSAEPIEGNIADALEFLADDMGVLMPLTDFFAANATDMATSGITSAVYVDEAIIGGVVTDHLAFRTEDLDYQIWVAANAPALPQRYVVTYKNEPGQPQFWAQFSNWNMSPEISDAMFTYEPTKDARRIDFEPAELPEDISQPDGGEK